MEPVAARAATIKPTTIQKLMSHTSTAQLGTSSITFETGKLARLADGAVVARSGDTIILATVVSATSVKEGQDFFPLTVDYREKAASVGKFPGGYFKSASSAFSEGLPV